MKLTSQCGTCGHTNQFDLSQAGKPARCEFCGVPLTVPRPREGPEGSSAEVETVKFECPACGRKFVTKAELAGKKIRCGGCGGGVRVPAAVSAPEATAAANPAAPASRRNLKTFGDDTTPVRPSAPVAPQARAAAPPPAATWEVDDEDEGGAYGLLGDIAAEAPAAPKRAEPVLPSRTEMLEKARREAAEQDDQSPGGNKPKKKKKRKKQTGFFDPKETLKLVAGVGAFVAVIALIAWRSPEFRFPLGGLLCVTGFIVYLLGAYSIRQLVAEEGMLNLLAYRFFPPYQWWFVISRWSETKDYFAFFASGLLILTLGGSILKLSPQGRLADQAEKAFLKAQAGQESADGDDEAEPPPSAVTRKNAPAPAAAAPGRDANSAPTQRVMTPPAEAAPPPAQAQAAAPASSRPRGRASIPGDD
jgi:DNA-directed RNA polymerase subunit RPC12/RpoP